MFDVETVLSGDSRVSSVEVEAISGFEGDGELQPPPAEFIHFDAGEHALLFLATKEPAEDALYTYINSQGAYEGRGEQIADRDGPADELIAKIQQETFTEAVNRIADAARRVTEGDLKPQPPDYGPGSGG